jgi:peptidoglycan/xylan/chitin deacetylase (PgdA/CDA1 family)
MFTFGGRSRRSRRRRLAAAVLLTVAATAALFGLAASCARQGGGPSPATSATGSASSSPATSASATASASPTSSPSPLVPQLPASARSIQVPILMYHVLGAPGHRVPYPKLFVATPAFEEQMKWLSTHGYHVVTLGEVYAFWRGQSSLPVKPVVVSFDDGYASDITVAAPVLAGYGWSGTLNLVVESLTTKGGLTRTQVRTLAGLGWEIDAHSIHHYDLTTLGAALLRQEVADCRRLLRETFRVPVDFFCYPSGRYDATVIAAVQAAGFLGATTTLEGLASPAQPYELRRVRVDDGEPLQSFVERLAGH